MTAIVAPTDEEAYLYAILTDPSGLDLAEFCFTDPESPTGCYRAWPVQWRWYTCDDMFQVDQSARSCGKSMGIVMRAFSFPFNFPGQRMLITAPELNHLRPLTDMIESRLDTSRLMREMRPIGKGGGIVKQPHWQARFNNGAQIISRLPNRDGRGLKGQHVIQIEFDECFPAGTLILTRRGQIPIEDVVVGDQVLTHKNRWRPVTATMTRENRKTLRIRGQGHPGLVTSTDHEFWAMRPEARLVRNHDGGLLKQETFSQPEYISAREMAGARWASPTTFPKCKGEGIPKLRLGQGRRPGDYIPVVDVRSADFYWVVGLYVAEGSLGSSRTNDIYDRITFSIHEDETTEVLLRLRKLGLSPVGPYPVHDGRAVNIVIQGNDFQLLAAWLQRHFGKGAHHKEIAPWALGLPAECRRALLDGLVYGDGFYCADVRYEVGRWKVSTVSRALAVTCRLLALSLGYHVSLYWSDTSNREVFIRGRRVNSKGFYQVVGGLKGQGLNFRHQLFTAVRQVTPTGQVETLYDLTVDEDHSFIAEGFIVSNCQDMPPGGWTEAVETLNRGLPGAGWRCHGVPKGIRDNFYEITEGQSADSDIQWKVHRVYAMNRPTWSAEERNEKIKQYGGSRQSIDYRRNIYGDHGDATNSTFVLAKLIACVDTDEGSKYNADVYQRIAIEHERLPTGVSDDMRQAYLASLIVLPGEHFGGWSQKVGNREVGSPNGYSAYWAGGDIGVTRDPTEILVCGQRTGSDFLDLLLRVHLKRINTDDQKFVIGYLFGLYGSKLKAFGIDSTGVGFPIADQLTRDPGFGNRVHGFGFSEKRPAAFEDRPLERGETKKDLVIMRNVVESGTDWLRNDYVDAGKIRLPYDKELLLEMQGQTYVTQSDTGNPYGTRRIYGGGTFHTLDGLKMLMAGMFIPPLEAILNKGPEQPPILDQFLGDF